MRPNYLGVGTLRSFPSKLTYFELTPKTNQINYQESQINFQKHYQTYNKIKLYNQTHLYQIQPMLSQSQNTQINFQKHYQT